MAKHTVTMLARVELNEGDRLLFAPKPLDSETFPELFELSKKYLDTEVKILSILPRPEPSRFISDLRKKYEDSAKNHDGTERGKQLAQWQDYANRSANALMHRIDALVLTVRFHDGHEEQLESDHFVLLERVPA